METISNPNVNHGKPLPVITMGKITDPEVLAYLMSISTPIQPEPVEAKGGDAV